MRMLITRRRDDMSLALLVGQRYSTVSTWGDFHPMSDEPLLHGSVSAPGNRVRVPLVSGPSKSLAGWRARGVSPLPRPTASSAS